MKKLLYTAVIAFAVTAVAFFLISCTGAQHLRVYDSETGKIIASYLVYEGDEFSVEFIHSVNQSPVQDVFVIHNGKIIADRTIYSAFGAGVQTEIEEGQTLEYDDEGNMVVSGFDIEFPEVKYIVGTVSDHILHIGEEYISLTELCGKNAHISFKVE